MRLLLSLFVLALAFAPAARADPGGREIVAVMDEYLRLWNAHDAAAINERIYRLSPDNPMSTPAGLQAQFDRLKAQGYDRSAKTAIEACVIGPNLALAEFRYSRLKADGTPLPPKDRATLYVLRKFPEGWRIVQLLGMDASAKVSCTSSRR